MTVPDTPSLLIAGCGDIGTRLGLAMAREDWAVFGLRRSAAALPAPLTAIRADLSRPQTLRQLPAAQCVLYIAAADRFDEDAYRNAYVRGVRNLIEALGWQDGGGNGDGGGERLLLFVSSTGVYGRNDGGWVNEDSATEPRGFNGRLMLEGEAIAAAAAVRTVRVRFSGIYGPGRTRMLEQVRGGLRAPPQPVAYTNRIHTEDCVGVLAHLLRLHRTGAPLENLYLASDNAPAPLHEVHRHIAELLQLPAAAGGGNCGGRRNAGSKRCDNRRLRDSGYRFIHPDYRSGYGALLEGMAS